MVPSAMRLPGVLFSASPPPFPKLAYAVVISVDLSLMLQTSRAVKIGLK